MPIEAAWYNSVGGKERGQKALSVDCRHRSRELYPVGLMAWRTGQWHAHRAAPGRGRLRSAGLHDEHPLTDLLTSSGHPYTADTVGHGIRVACQAQNRFQSVKSSPK